MSGDHFPPPVPVAVATSEVEERNFDNTSPELVMMALHSNVCDDRHKNNNRLDGVIPTDAPKETFAENQGSGQGIQVGWTIYIGDTESLPVPMIPLASSWISPKRISASTFTQGETTKPLVLPLGVSKQQPLPLDRASPTPFPHQNGASEKVTPLLESTHDRGNNDKEIENLTTYTARSLFKGEIQSPSPDATEVEGTLVIATASRRAIELYGDKKEAGEEGEKSLSSEDVSLFLERGDHGLSKQARGNNKPWRRR